LLQPILIILVSLGAITLGAEFLVRGSSRLALRAGVSSLFVGLTIVGFGTSSPELGASLTATLRQSSDVAMGNVVGSNIFNIGAILGLTALLKPIRVQLAAVRRDLLVAVGAALVPWLALPFAGYIPRPVGMLLLALLVTYIAFAYRTARQAPSAEVRLVEEEMAPALSVKKSSTLLDIVLVVAGLGLLVLGSRGFVDAAIGVARQIGWSELLIGLTLVSAGTSLPELVTSLVAMRRGDAEIAVGNVIGSNIFNAFGIVGVCATVAPQAVNNSVTMRDTPVMLLATLALLPMMRSGGRISRLEGGAAAGRLCRVRLRALPDGRLRTAAARRWSGQRSSRRQ
jgi:cation:H+ antiporter